MIGTLAQFSCPLILLAICIKAPLDIVPKSAQDMPRNQFSWPLTLMVICINLFETPRTMQPPCMMAVKQFDHRVLRAKLSPGQSPCMRGEKTPTS